MFFLNETPKLLLFVEVAKGKDDGEHTLMLKY
jgi:hypothetical protein